MKEILSNLIGPCAVFAACIASALIAVFCYHCGRANRTPLPTVTNPFAGKPVDKPVMPSNIPIVKP